jgi:hypothetical protein
MAIATRRKVGKQAVPWMVRTDKMSPIVTACALNGACREASSGPLLVDSSGPLPADLYKDPVLTTATRLQVSWTACEDPHSGIGTLFTVGMWLKLCSRDLASRCSDGCCGN